MRGLIPFAVIKVRIYDDDPDGEGKFRVGAAVRQHQCLGDSICSHELFPNGKKLLMFMKSSQVSSQIPVFLTLSILALENYYLCFWQHTARGTNATQKCSFSDPRTNLL